MTIVPFEMKHDENQIALGKSAASILSLDLMKLIESRMLTCANSGAGKSTLLRLIVERASGKIPFIILDWEGEFVTLREKFDVVLVSNDGEIPIDLRSAKLLARKLIELHASAVIDLSDLIEPTKKRQYVRDFIDSLISLPRSLWNPTIIGIDEAHLLCPEKDASESAKAVINLLSLGRKRNLCAILASQRISKIHKDALAECKNVFIGNTWLDIDRKRAIDNLGLGKEGNQMLRELGKGEFFAFGPALSLKGVHRFQADDSETHAPKAGERHKLIIPKTSDVVSHIVEKLADLPQKAQEEIKNLEQAQSRIRELERAVKMIPTVPQEQLQNAYKDVEKRFESKLASETQAREDAERIAAGWYDKHEEMSVRLNDALSKLLQINQLSDIGAVEPETIEPKPVFKTQRPRSLQVLDDFTSKPKPVEKPRIAKSASSNNSKLPEGERKILTAIAQYPEGASREQLSILTGYKRSSRDAYIQRLRGSGFVSIYGSQLFATEQGVAALGDFEPLPTGAELREYWLARLPEGEKRVLEVLVSAYPNSVVREAIDTNTGYKRSSRDAYIQRLSARRLVDAVGRGEVKANSILFD